MVLNCSKMTDEKYDKARKQQSQNRTLFLVFFAFVGIAAWYILNNASKRQQLKQASLNKNEPVVLKVPPAQSMKSLVAEVQELDAAVRKIKASGVMPMETDPEALVATKKLQEATRRLLGARYGHEEPYRVEIILEFQDTIPDFEEKGKDGSILLEMAPSRLQPHSIFSFLEVARQYKGGAFHRIANHVLQVMVKGNFPHLAFQEYSEEYPHKERTVGYAGRPSGPAWYVSIMDNVKNHGPGSQQDKNPYEADSCFGRVIRGYDEEVQRIRKVPGNGFLDDRKKHVLIKEMKILVPGDGPDAVDGYVEWKEEL